MNIECKKDSRGYFKILKTDFCCNDMREAWDEAVQWDDYRQRAYIEYTEVGGGYYIDDTPFHISFCPFCGMEITSDVTQVERPQSEIDKELQIGYFKELAKNTNASKNNVYIVNASPQILECLHGDIHIFKSTLSPNEALNDLNLIIDNRSFIIDTLIIRAGDFNTKTLCKIALLYNIDVVVIVSESYEEERSYFEESGAFVISNLPTNEEKDNLFNFLSNKK